MEEVPTHNLNFRSGMLTSWNKFCFQGGYVELSAILPGGPSTQGYWPGAWMMGNLGRPGYLATTDGLWPYAYEACDVGILENQTNIDGSGPDAALKAKQISGKRSQISKLPGMRSSSCTCPGEDHPGPHNNVARMVPELDIFEVQVTGKHSFASQSYQVAPYDADYEYGKFKILGDQTKPNPWKGGVWQEAVSGVSQVPDSAFQKTSRTPCTFGVEYTPDWKGPGSGMLTFYVDGKPTWTLDGSMIGPNKLTQIAQRTFPTEPMMLILNLGVRPRPRTRLTLITDHGRLSDSQCVSASARSRVLITFRFWRWRRRFPSGHAD